MGQSSSATSKTALPATNLLIDASESYVTDVKLRSTAIIPISEYIKKDKFSKNIQRLKQVKKSPPEEKVNKVKEKNDKKGKLETIDEEIKHEKDTTLEDNTRRKIEHIKKEKQHFIESSYEDIPDKRKWVNEHSSPKYLFHNGTHVRNRKTQTKIHRSHNTTLTDIDDSYTSQDSKDLAAEIMQIYKNDVYPHVYKNRHKKRKEKKLEELRKMEEEQRRNEQKKEEEKKKLKEQETPHVDSNMNLSKTDMKKSTHKNEESTHHLTQHHFKRIAQFFKKPKLNNLVVQTNVACVIHPNKRQRFSSCSSEERIKKPIIANMKRYLPALLKQDEDNKKYNSYESSSNTSTAIIHRKVDKIDKVTEEHRKFLSGRQALANWKNIHTLRQHRKLRQPKYDTYPEENYKSNHRNPYTEDRYNVEYNPERNSGTPMEYIVPPRRNRSRAGYRGSSSDIERMDRKMTPLEISNYKYSKMPPHIKMEYVSPKEIKERNQRMKYQNPRDNFYERPGTPRYEYIETSTYGGYPQQSRYRDTQKYPNYLDNYDVRPKMSLNNDRCYRSNPMPEISEKEERNMDKEDFIADIERCLQKRQKMASVYNRVQTPNKTGWVQDKYRRWHKVVRNDCE